MREDRPNAIPWPPVLLAGSLLLALALHRFLPWPLPADSVGLLRPAGLGLGVLALAIDVWAAATLHRFRTAILPHRGASTLVTSGPFAWSRNPIYVGNAMLLIAIGLVIGSVWFFLGAVILVLLTHHLVVKREEQHLKHRFGDAWSEYAARTPRWLFI